MFKVLNGFDWLEEEIGEETPEIKECIKLGLIKYTDDESRPQFIVLEKNIPAVKEILGEDYNRLKEKDFLEWLEFEFGGSYEGLEIKNIFDNKISVSMDVLIDLINDEEESYFDEDMKLEIYNSECPNAKLYDYLNEMGREQAKIQIQGLLDNISNQVFR